jgi:hypothetical protein
MTKQEFQKTGRTRRLHSAAKLLISVAAIALLAGCDAISGLFGGGEMYFELAATPAEPTSNQQFTVEVIEDTATEGATFAWTFTAGPGDIEVDGQSHPSSDTAVLAEGTDLRSITATAITQGSYSFMVRAELDGEFAENGISVTVGGGAVALSGPIDTDTTLVDIIQDPAAADYTVSSDLEINATLSFGGRLRIQFEPGASLIINNGGELDTTSGPWSTLAASDPASGWKGIHAKSFSTLNMSEITVDDAGAEAFTGYPASAFVFEDSVTVTDFSGININNETGLNVYFDAYKDMANAATVTMAGATPYNIPFAMIGDLVNWAILDSTETTTGVLRGSGNTTISVSQSGSISPWVTLEGSNNNGVDNYIIESGLTLNSDQVLSINTNGTVGIEGGTGLSVGGLVLDPGNGEILIIESSDGADWTGITSESVRVAGGGTVNITDAAGTDTTPGVVSGTEETAAIVTNGSPTDGKIGFGLEGSLSITTTADYGIYQNTWDTYSADSGSSLTVSTPTSAGLSLYTGSLDILAGTLSFTMPASSDLPAVEIRARSGSNTDTNNVTIPALGGGNFYSVLVDPIFVLQGSSVDQTLTFADGVDMRFDSGVSLTITTNDISAGDEVVMAGTSGTGVILQPLGTTSQIGSWDGVYIDAFGVDIDYTTIQGGGEVAQWGSPPTAANLVLGPLTDAATIHNSAFDNSGGYGIVIEPDGATTDFTDGALGNSFTGNTNTAVDVLVQ